MNWFLQATGFLTDHPEYAILFFGGWLAYMVRVALKGA